MQTSVPHDDGGSAPDVVYDIALKDSFDDIDDIVDVDGESTAGGIKTAATEKKYMKKKKKSYIQVSKTKKPLGFYLNLAKRSIKQCNDVKLSAIGMAIPTAILISEILKRNGVAIEKEIVISSVGSKSEEKGRIVQKSQVVLHSSID